METPSRGHPFDVLVALGVHTDRAPELASSTVQATRDGACSDTEHQSHVSAGPALEIHQVQHLPKRRRKPPDSPFESRVQDLAYHDRLGTVVRLQPLDDQGGRVRHHGWSRPATRPVDMSVAHDRQQPRPRVATIEAVDAPISTQQRVLHQVVTIGTMAGDRPRHPREHRQLRDDEPLEDLRCTLARRRIHTPLRHRLRPRIQRRIPHCRGHRLTGTRAGPVPAARWNHPVLANPSWAATCRVPGTRPFEERLDRGALGCDAGRAGVPDHVGAGPVRLSGPASPTRRARPPTTTPTRTTSTKPPAGSTSAKSPHPIRSPGVVDLLDVTWW